MVNDIQKPNALDGAWARALNLRGLKSVGQLFTKERKAVLTSLKEGIKQMFKPRLSYNPDTIFNKVSNFLLTSPAKNLVKFLGIANPGSEKSAFVAKFQSVNKDTDLKALDIPGYDSFKALSRDTQIAMLGGQTKPDAETDKLGLHIIRPNSSKQFEEGINKAKTACENKCSKFIDTISKAKQSLLDLEQKKQNELSGLKDSPEDWLKRDNIIEKYDKLIQAFRKTLKKAPEQIQRATEQRDAELSRLNDKLKAKSQAHKEVDKLFNALPANIKESLNKYGAVIDKFSGMPASLLYDPSKKTVHVVFGGTEAGTDLVGKTNQTAQKNLDDQTEAGTNLLGKIQGKIMFYEQLSNDITAGGVLSNHVPPSYDRARELVGAIKTVNKEQGLGINIEVKGFSMGGGMAAYAGMYHDVKTLSHCGAPLSPACQRSLGIDKMENAVKNNKIFNTSVQGDWVTDRPKIQDLARKFETITSLQVARHIGNGLRLSGEGMTVGNHQWKDIHWGLKHPSSAKLFKAYETMEGSKKTSPVTQTAPEDNMTEIKFI